MLDYLAKASLLIIVYYGTYYLIFRNFSFHKVNRFFLLFLTLYALISPFLDFEIHNTIKSPGIDRLLKQSHNLAGNYQSIKPSNPVPGASNFSNIFLFIYWIGVYLFFARFFIQILKLLKIKLASRVILLNNEKVHVSDRISQPFSFFNWIFVPATPHLNIQVIVQHERIHANQLHSIDNIAIEFVNIFFWFHPFIYLIKRSMHCIHEFHTDCQVIQNRESLGVYLNEILRTTRSSHFTGIINPFYGSNLKKRVKMMTRNHTPKGMWSLYILIIPFFMMVSFSISMNPGNQNNIPSTKPILEPDITRISSVFGMREHPITGEMKMHPAVDITAKKGTPVIATADGKVIKKEFKESGKGHGRLILIQHDKVYATLYTQLSGYNVKLNQQVKQGDIIGYVGSSGISTGPHLHYEVWKDGDKVDPGKYFTIQE